MSPVVVESSGSGRTISIAVHDSPSMPMAVICVSPYLTPSRYSTDREYALIRQLSARIWYICIEVTRVHRP